MKDNIVYLKHIRNSISAIEEFVKDISQSEFFTSRVIQNAVIRELEIIGEATKRLNKEFRQQYKEINWAEIAGMRDKLIHEYLEVDIEIVWKTIKEDLPILKAYIYKMLKEL